MNFLQLDSFRSQWSENREVFVRRRNARAFRSHSVAAFVVQSETREYFRLGPSGRAFRFQAFALALGLGLAAFGLAGCDSISEATSDVKQKFVERDQPQVRPFEADPRTVYAAALKAIDRMGFRYLRGGPAQGVLEAASGLSAGRSLETTHQVTLKVKFESAPDGSTDVQLHIYEVIEGDANRGEGQGVAAPMRDTPLYEDFFREVKVALSEPKKT